MIKRNRVTYRGIQQFAGFSTAGTVDRAKVPGRDPPGVRVLLGVATLPFLTGVKLRHLSGVLEKEVDLNRPDVITGWE